MGSFSATGQTVIGHPAERIYDFVSNPHNWPKTFKGSAGMASDVPLPLKTGDTWTEVVSPSEGFSCRSTWTLIIAERPRKWVFQQVDKIGGAADGGGGVDGITTIAYTFEPVTEGRTLFTRTLTCELPRGVRIPDPLLVARAHSANIEAYQDAVARELDEIAAGED